MRKLYRAVVELRMRDPDGVLRGVCVETGRKKAVHRILVNDPIWKSLAAEVVKVTEHYAPNTYVRFEFQKKSGEVSRNPIVYDREPGSWVW